MKTNTNMFLELLFKGSLICAVVSSSQIFEKHPEVDAEHSFMLPDTKHMGANSDWNYDQNGADWNFTSCNMTNLP